MSSDFEKARAAWEEGLVKKTLEKFPERRGEFRTPGDIPIERVYDPDCPCGDFMETHGFPGEYPFTRGVQPTMYRGRFWTMRQYAGFGTAEESNRRYRYLLEAGQTGLSVAFDLPTQIGYDSDHPLCAGEVGKVGVAIDSLADMEILFGGIPLDTVSTSMTINAPASVLLAMYIAVAEKQGINRQKLQGTIQNDILKEYMARGTYIFPPSPSMRLITDIFAFCRTDVPKWNTISISGYHIREAGSTAAQEVAFTLADGIAYVEAAIKAGMEVDEFGPRLSFFFNAHNDLFEEVAKFRAARRLWARIMKDRFRAADPRSQMLRFHTQTGGSTLTAQQPDNNIVRVAVQTLAAVLGGTQSLHTNSRDEALALPTEHAVTIALRTQQIIATESGVTDTVDPLGGSWYLENLTDTVEKQAMELIADIDAMGGMVRAIEEGYPQRRIQDAAYNYQKQVESGDRVVVGVNKFQQKETGRADLLKVNPEVENSQREKLSAVKAQRGESETTASLSALRLAARGSDNLMPPILDCVRRYATLGEICGVLREEFGEYQPKTVV
jgi:methylmalonyl-CoA mutase N-terminal domain/subunit